MNNRVLAALAVLIVAVAAIAGYALLGPRTGVEQAASTAPVAGTMVGSDQDKSLGDLSVVDQKFGASSPVDATQKEVIENIIREYLMEHPEVIRDAMEALEQKRIADESERQTKAIADNREKLLNSPLQVVLGNPAGDVTLVEFFDYNCGYCRRAHADMTRLINEDSKLRVVLKEFPVLGPASMEAAQVAIAVNIVAPEKYGEFHDKMLADKAQASADRAVALAESIGIDGTKLREAVQNETVGKTIEEVYAMANSLGLTGTPSYVVGDEVVVGAVGYDELKSKIDAVRACGSTIC
jgi:protein-disulfide isomerase